MAQKVITQLVDDLDETVLNDGDGETVTFALDGTAYEIDLSNKNADALRGVFQDYIAAARKVSRSTSTGTPRSTRKRAQSGSPAAEIRAWAQSQGIDVPDRGRIPQDVRDKFDAR